MKLHLVSYDSRHYSFEGCGNSEAEALDLCIQALRAHGKQCSPRLPADWWWRYPGLRSEREASTMASGLFASRVIERGGAYRDKEPI